MKRNQILIIIILGVLGFGIAGTYFGGALLIKHRVAGWRRDGIAASIAGNHERAAELLARCLQRNPHDIEALTYFIKSREQAELPNGRQFADTMAALKLLLSEDPSRVDDRRHLLELYVKFERRPEALDTANEILAKTPKDGRTLQLKAEVLAALHRNTEALDAVEVWVRAAPLDLDAQMARMGLSAELGRPRAPLIDDAERLRKAHPNDPRFEILEGYACALAADEANSADAQALRVEASNWLKTAAKRPNLSDSELQVLVRQFDDLGMSQQALDLLRALVKNGGSADLRKTLACRVWQLGLWGEAADILAPLDPKNPADDSTLLAFKAIALANLGKKTEAQSCLSELARHDKSVPKVWALLLRRLVNNETIDDEEVIADCGTALRSEPNNSYLAYYLGDAEARMKELDLSIEFWRQVVIMNPTWSLPSARLVDALLQKGSADLALRVATSAARHTPSSAAIVIALSRALAACVESGAVARSDEVLKFVSEIQKQLPGESQTLIIEIQLLARKQDKSEAIRAGRLAIERSPAPEEGVFLAIEGISRKYGLGLEEECFSRCEAAHGLSAPLAYARALDAAGGTAGPEGAKAGLKLFDALAQRSGKSGELPWQLARARYLDVGRQNEAHAAWIALGDAHSKDLEVQQAAVNASAVRGDWDFLLRTIDRLHALTGDKGLAWRLAKVRLMVESPRSDDDYEQGSILLNQLIKEYPSLTEPRVLLARALVRMKRVDGAIEQLSEAAKLDPTSVPIALQLATLLAGRGDFERVNRELDRVNTRLRSPIQRGQAALLLAQQGNEKRAIDLLEAPQAEPGQDESRQEQLLLASLYRRRHQIDKAEAIARKLLEKPDVAAIEFGAALYASQGRRTEAEQTLAKLDGLKLDPGVKESVWGIYSAQLGDLKEAVKHFQAATQQAPTNALGWRVLATYQAASGKIDDALTTIDQATRAVPSDRELAAIKAQSALLRGANADSEIWPIVIAVMRDPLNSKELLGVVDAVTEAHRTLDMQRLANRLQQLIDQHPESLIVHLQLAQCLWSMGRTEEALAGLRRAMNAFPNNPEPARVAVELCRRSERWQEMVDAAESWKRRLPDSPLAADLAIAKGCLGMNEARRVIDQLQPYLDAARSEPDRYADLLEIYSTASVIGGDSQTADDLLWPQVKKDPSWRKRWMNSAVLDPDSKRAGERLDRIAQIIPPDALDERATLAQAYDLVGRRSNNPALIRKATEEFARVVASPAVDANALLAAGAQAEATKDFAIAKSLYQRALEKDPSLWVADNNLAMVLSKTGGNSTQAVQLAVAAVKLQPRLATLYDTLGQAQAKAGSPRAAADSEASAIKLEPDNAKWRTRYAQYLLDSGDVIQTAKAVQGFDDIGPSLRAMPPAEQQLLVRQMDDIRKKLRTIR